jgi:hypothetical protein
MMQISATLLPAKGDQSHQALFYWYTFLAAARYPVAKTD